MAQQTNPKDQQQTGKENQSNDPRERLHENPALATEEARKNTSHGDKNDLLNEDPMEEKEAIEKSSEDRLSEAE